MKTKLKSGVSLRWITAVLLLAGMVFYENNVFCTKVYEMPVHNLPTQFENYRIVQITDLHSKMFGKNHEALLAEVRAQMPDAIFLTGDLVNEREDIKTLKPLLTGLASIAPTYFVTGNHEWNLGAERREELFSLITHSGVTWLKGTYDVVERDGAKLVIAGVNDRNAVKKERNSQRRLVRDIRKDVGEDACILVLSHRNTELSMWANLGVNAVFCGHVHGGIVRQPFVGGVFGTEREFFPKYDSGLFRMDDTVMLVSPGFAANDNIPIRILNRPELSVAVLKP